MQHQIADDKLLQLQAGIEKIKLRFIEALPERVAELDGLLDQLYETGNIEKVVEAIGQRAHKLHGLSGSFGFAPIGAAAVKLEHAVNAAMRGPKPIQFEGVEAETVALLDFIELTLKQA